MIMVVALVVLGPEKLPGAARQIGQVVRQLRRISTGFQQELQNTLDEPVEAEARRRGQQAVEESKKGSEQAADPTTEQPVSDTGTGRSLSNGGTMTLMEHLVELRSRLIKSVLAVVVGAVVCWILYPQILDLLLQPYCDVVPEEAVDEEAARQNLFGGCELLVLDPLEPFSVRLTVAGYGGLALAIPWCSGRCGGLCSPASIAASAATRLRSRWSAPCCLHWAPDWPTGASPGRSNSCPPSGAKTW